MDRNYVTIKNVDGFKKESVQITLTKKDFKISSKSNKL